MVTPSMVTGGALKWPPQFNVTTMPSAKLQTFMSVLMESNFSEQWLTRSFDGGRKYYHSLFSIDSLNKRSFYILTSVFNCRFTKPKPYACLPGCLPSIFI